MDGIALKNEALYEERPINCTLYSRKGKLKESSRKCTISMNGIITGKV
jgi:hypothetical protein